MLPASLYTPVYYHAMLLVVFGCALVYWSGQGQGRSLTQFNQVAMVVIGVGVILFMGFRPISGVFMDMATYAWDYERVQQGGEGSYADRLFNGLMRLCGPVLPAKGFFFVCALIYIAPLAVASWRVHGSWAFPVFLACLTAFSFWAYGVNGIRNGMAASVLILAFAFHDQPVVMFPLMVAAWGLHGATLLPASAFLIVRCIRRTEIWLAFWVVCVATSIVAGNVGEMVLSRYNPFAYDARAETYILGSEGSGFRADFLAYSIAPVLVTLLLAAPIRYRARRLASRIMNRPAMNWVRNRSAMSMQAMAMGKQLCLQPAGPGGSAPSATSGRVSRALRAAPLSTLNSQLSTPTRSIVSSGQSVSARRDKTPQSAWGRLPWVQFLRMDPFYARLINTYLLANALWVLAIHANFSNRFAYLSWFMMPWVLLYPFVPGNAIDRPRTGLIAAILCAHYLFTYVMEVVVSSLRGGGFL